MTAVRDLELDLDVFAGPFDLLLSLILREELDLLEVELAEVVLTYLDHLEARGDLDLEAEHAAFVHDIFGNPFRPVSFNPSWATPTATALAARMYESRDFGALPILADALQDAGCEHPDVLDHCRNDPVHVRGCWVVDLLLGKM